MKLDYFTLLCPEPISLSIGTLRQPTLRDIGKLTYPKFGMYQVYLKLTPKDYYTLLCGDKGNEYWNMLSDEQKKDISIYDIILLEESIANTYLEILNFFLWRGLSLKIIFFLFWIQMIMKHHHMKLKQIVLWSEKLVQKHLQMRSEEHTSELQSHSDISYAVFCLAHV